MALAATRPPGHQALKQPLQPTILHQPFINPPQRPRSLQELSIQAKEEVGWDATQKVTYWLHKAEQFREKAALADQNQDNETTWIELTKSTDILHRLKEHQGYRTYFTDSQRSTMAKNFDYMLARMMQLKPVLMSRYDNWVKEHPIPETSEDERRKEEERRLDREAQARRHAREEMQKQAERDLIRRQEEAARKEREAREAREEQLRKHAENELKYRQMRERPQDYNKPPTKYSKASDSANAALQEAQKERERRKQTRLEVERRESISQQQQQQQLQLQQQQQQASTPTASNFPTSRDIRGATNPAAPASYTTTILTASAPKPDDDIILVGSDGRQQAHQRSRNSSLMDKSPNSVSVQPSSGSDQYLSISPSASVALARTSPSSGSGSGVSPNMVGNQSQNYGHGTRRPSMAQSTTVPPASFSHSYSHSESLRRESSTSAAYLSKADNNQSVATTPVAHPEQHAATQSQPSIVRREATIPAAASQTHFTTTSQSSGIRSTSSNTALNQNGQNVRQGVHIFRQPGLIIEDMTAKQTNNTPTKPDSVGINRVLGRAATQVEENRADGPNPPLTGIARSSAAAVSRSQTLPVDQTNGYNRGGGEESMPSIPSNASTLGTTPHRQSSISRQNSVSTRDNTPIKGRQGSVPRAATMPNPNDPATIGFIPQPPPPETMDISSTPMGLSNSMANNSMASTRGRAPARLDTNLSRSLARGQLNTPQTLSATPTSHITRYSTTASEATDTPPSTFAGTPNAPGQKPADPMQISPTPYKESKLAFQYNLPKPPQPSGVLSSETESRNKGKGVDRSFSLETSGPPLVIATGITRGSREPSPIKDDRVKDRILRNSTVSNMQHASEFMDVDDPSFLGASNARPSLSRSSSSSQGSKGKLPMPQEDIVMRHPDVSKQIHQSNLESAQQRGDHSGSGSESDRRASRGLGSSLVSRNQQFLAPPDENSSFHSPQGSQGSSLSPNRHSSGASQSSKMNVVAGPSQRSLEKRPAEPEPPRPRKPKLLSEAGSDVGEDGYLSPAYGELSSRPPSTGVTYDSVSESGGASNPNAIDLPTQHPLQSPRRWINDESSADEHGRKLPPLPSHTWNKRSAKRSDDERETASIQGPPPMTTTSPRPPDYPPVPANVMMNTHQLAQGYSPSLNSIISNMQEHRPIQESILLSNKCYQFTERNLVPQNPYPRRPGKPSQMPVQLMDQRSQAEAARVRQFDSKKDRPMPNLKPVDVPRDILKRFMALSAENTELGKETLGLLLGKIRNDKYVVTTLLIPNQMGGPDWCTMEDDDMIVQFQERRFLVTLGWIHTHPTQTCFMSSCDLHTHAPYQKMLPEAFAIVCAPNYQPNFGVFRLTDPPGLRYVLDCKKPEMFHTHETANLYTDCDSAHVSLVDGIGLEICDIRRQREIS